MELKTKITKIHYDKNAKGLLVKILEFGSIFYGFGSGLKNLLYDKKIIKPKAVEAYVISVGNITTGGVGKTPVVAEIAKYLMEKGFTPAIVSRGYGGKLSNKNINVISDGKTTFFNAQQAGDEPFWLAQNTAAIVITTKNRFEGAQFAVEKFQATHIILDDGFQHRKLHRNLDIVLMDSKMCFGNEKLLPAGPLREGMEAFKRINKFVIVSKDVDHKRAEKLAKIYSNIPTIVCKTEPDFVYNIKTNQHLQAPADATAMCAIGQPEQFFAFLKDYNIENQIALDDHHQYTLDDINNIKGNIIVTEKDAVKLKNFDLDNIYALKLKTVIDVKGLLDEHL